MTNLSDDSLLVLLERPIQSYPEASFATSSEKTAPLAASLLQKAQESLRGQNQLPDRVRFCPDLVSGLYTHVKEELLRRRIDPAPSTSVKTYNAVRQLGSHWEHSDEESVPAMVTQDIVPVACFAAQQVLDLLSPGTAPRTHWKSVSSAPQIDLTVYDTKSNSRLIDFEIKNLAPEP